MMRVPDGHTGFDSHIPGLSMCHGRHVYIGPVVSVLLHVVPSGANPAGHCSVLSTGVPTTQRSPSGAGVLPDGHCSVLSASHLFDTVFGLVPVGHIGVRPPGQVSVVGL